MSRCDGCAEWITAEITRYDDGTEIVNRQSAENKGSCRILKIETDPEFGCNRFQAGDDHQIVTQKSGAPWQHFVMIKCPACNAGETCHGRCQCAGTGLVRKYDDGFLGDESTRMHPKEVNTAAPPKCRDCGGDMNPGWVACPACGTRVLVMADPKVVSIEDSLHVR